MGSHTSRLPCDAFAGGGDWYDLLHGEREDGDEQIKITGLVDLMHTF